MTQYRTCRTCLEANKNCNIFQSTQNNKIISELIMEFVPVMIQRDDNLPDSICNICLEKLNYVIDFREMVAKSHGALSQQLGNNEWGDIKVELEDSRVSTDLTDWKEDFNEIDQKPVDRDIGQSLVELNDSENGSASETALEKHPMKFYLNFDRRNNKVLHSFNEEQLKVIVNNPD